MAINRPPYSPKEVSDKFFEILSEQFRKKADLIDLMVLKAKVEAEFKRVDALMEGKGKFRGNFKNFRRVVAWYWSFVPVLAMMLAMPVLWRVWPRKAFSMEVRTNEKLLALFRRIGDDAETMLNESKGAAQ